jgi:DUF4097 and DUF4098 domain-containing protein YvlB
MRRFLTPLIASFLPLLIAAPLLSAEATRTLRAELPESAAKSFAVENLAGSMVVRPGSGSKVVAIATVHAESTALAKLVRFEQVEGKDGRPTLRVRYPLDEHRTIRYPGKETSDPGFLSRLFGGDSQTRTKYDGRRVTVKSDSGILLYADVEVEVPAGSAAAGFSVVAGPMSGSDLEGAFSFSTGAGGVHLETVSGEIEVDTGSGNVKVEDGDGDIEVDTGSGEIAAIRLHGRFSFDTGSGDCTVREFSGEAISGDTGSGDITVRSSTADRISLDTGSGDISVLDSDVAELNADTGSGDVRLSAKGNRLSRINADTGSGDVSLSLGPHASFKLLASQGSGDLINRYDDAQPILQDRELVGYQRGDARTRIVIDTGSGSVLIEPGNAAS